ncbi:MAG TPA: YbjN domain-containing protein [Caulobacteraceae bacterium]
MKTMLAALSMTAAFAAASSASASPVPDGGITAQEVSSVMQAKGYVAEIDKDAEGDPRIKSAADGGSFYVYFYGCHGGPRCSSIQFESAFHLKGGMTLVQINQWNKAHRFGRAYLDDVMDPYVEMDLDVEHGFLTEGLANNLDTWSALLPDFKKFIGWQ